MALAPSGSLREAEARLTRARLDAMEDDALDGIGAFGGSDAGGSDAPLAAMQSAELDRLQQQVDEASALVASLQTEAQSGLREVSSAADGLRDEGWRMSAFLQLEALKQQILEGDSDGAMATLEAFEVDGRPRIQALPAEPTDTSTATDSGG
jgi:hypothetical protein